MDLTTTLLIFVPRPLSVWPSVSGVLHIPSRVDFRFREKHSSIVPRNRWIKSNRRVVYQLSTFFFVHARQLYDFLRFSCSARVDYLAEEISIRGSPPRFFNQLRIIGVEVWNWCDIVIERSLWWKIVMGCDVFLHSRIVVAGIFFCAPPDPLKSS